MSTTLTKKEPTEVVTRRQTQPESFNPAVDIYETSDEVVLTFDMPGVGKDGVDITVDKGALTVTGKAAPEPSESCAYRETRIGDYRRQFSLSDDADVEHITAQMDAGVLTVRIPKAERAKPKKVKILSGT